MTRDDFKELPNFTYAEAARTGARVSGVRFGMMFVLQAVRTDIKRTIRLVKNGLNSGNHKSKTHQDGMAVDFALSNKAGKVTWATVKRVIYAMIDAGFVGIGVYYNGIAYSFHGDMGARRRTWTAIKVRFAKTGAYKNWQYRSLLVDPKTLLRKAA